MTETAGERRDLPLRARAYPAPWRIAAAALVAVSRASLPVIAVGVLASDVPVTLAALARALTLVGALPALAAWIIARAFAVDVAVRRDQVVLERPGLRVEVPSASIEDVVPWRLPLPGAGFSLRMRSGRTLGYGLEPDDPARLLAALVEIAGVAAAGAAARHPAVVWADAGRRRTARGWYHAVARAVAKFAGFALLPTALWFNLDQHITYGGLLGQYYLEGPWPYLRSFGVHWGLVTIYLLLYASLWRALAESVTLLAAGVAPSRAARVRRAAEIACRVAYYGGVPVIVLLPFLG